LKLFEDDCFLKAAVYRGSRNIKVEDVSKLGVSGRKVLVKSKAGVSYGKNIHFYRGEWKWMNRRQIIGHDACSVRPNTCGRMVTVSQA
jgi:hypothetical protein